MARQGQQVFGVYAGAFERQIAVTIDMAGHSVVVQSQRQADLLIGTQVLHQ